MAMPAPKRTSKAVPTPSAANRPISPVSTELPCPSRRDVHHAGVSNLGGTAAQRKPVRRTVPNLRLTAAWQGRRSGQPRRPMVCRGQSTTGLLILRTMSGKPIDRRDVYLTSAHTRCATRRSPTPSTPACRSATPRSWPATPTPEPPSTTTKPAETSTDTGVHGGQPPVQRVAPPSGQGAADATGADVRRGQPLGVRLLVGGLGL